MVAYLSSSIWASSALGEYLSALANSAYLHWKPKAVHRDVHMLLDVGILQKTDKGQIEFPFEAVHVDFMLKAA